MKTTTCFFAGLALLATSGNLLAQTRDDDQTDDADDIEEIIVEATRTQRSIRAIPLTVTVVPQERIEQSVILTNSLSGVLELNVPGFGPSQEKLAGRGETLRGRNPLYLIDGVPQHNPLRDSQRDGHHIDMDFVERVEVIHGSNSIQGIGATGGVINTVTKSAKEDGLSNEVNYRLTSADNFDGDGFAHHISDLVGYKSGNWSTSLGVAFTKQDLYFDANDEPVGLFATQGDTMDSTSSSVFFKSVFTPAEDHRLQLMVNQFELERDGDYVAVPGDRAENQLVATVPGDPRPVVGLPAQNDVLTASFDYIAEDILSWRLVSQVYYQDFAGRFEGGTFGGFFRLTVDGEPFLDQSEVVSEKSGLKILIHRGDFFDDRFGLTLGLDATSDSTAQVLSLSGREWVPDTEMTDLSPFVQLELSATDRLRLHAGFRHEDVELDVPDYTTIAAAGSTFVSGGTPSFTEPLVNVGAVFDINENLTLYASFAEGFTLPDVGRVLRNVDVPGTDVDTLIDLSPVVTDNTEIGLKFVRDAFDFDIALYRSESDLGARLQFTADNANAFVSREKTEIEGFDVAANFALNDIITIGGNYAYMDAKFDSDDDGSVDTDLDGVNAAPNKLVLYLKANFQRDLNIRLDAVKLFEREFRGPGISAARLGAIDFSDDYTLVNFIAQKAVGNGVFSLGIRNLLDEFYIAYYAQVDTSQSRNSFFSGRGRTFTFGYRMNFGT